MSRHYYITGVDGIGKTTQVDRLERHLSDRRTHRVWLRFPIVLSLPLLVYARLFGFTCYETFDGVRVGAWEFHRSALLRTLFPIAQYVDTVLHSIGKVWLPMMRGRTLLFERYAIDVLVDTMVATGQSSLYQGLLGNLFLRLVPRRTHIVILDAPVPQIRQRRRDLLHDPAIEARARAYVDVARHLRCSVIPAEDAVDVVEASIREEVARA